MRKCSTVAVTRTGTRVERMYIHCVTFGFSPRDKIVQKPKCAESASLLSQLITASLGRSHESPGRHPESPGWFSESFKSLSWLGNFPTPIHSPDLLPVCWPGLHSCVCTLIYIYIYIAVVMAAPINMPKLEWICVLSVCLDTGILATATLSMLGTCQYWLVCKRNTGTRIFWASDIVFEGRTGRESQHEILCYCYEDYQYSPLIMASHPLWCGGEITVCLSTILSWWTFTPCCNWKSWWDFTISSLDPLDQTQHLSSTGRSAVL